jgi:16S rRNA C967 or C1407 C5-methylase (RsmB/RsmF family)
MTKRFLLSMVLTFAAMTAFAQTGPQPQAEENELNKSYLYKWTDEQGVVHITDAPGKVPKQYRGKVIKLEERINAPDQAQPQRKQDHSPEYSREKDAEKKMKASWQQRLKEAKQRQANAEGRYRELENRRNEVLQRWGGLGGPASGRRSEVIEAEKIEQQMKVAQKEIDDARSDVEVVIPEEARKAGVPPGWLRE